MKIGIITSPFGALPPVGIGAVEKIWFYIAEEFSKKGNSVFLYAKEDNVDRQRFNSRYVYLKGYRRTGSLVGDIIKDFIYSVRALYALQPCDILVMNTFWSPVFCRLFKKKYKKSVYNVARMPKGQFRLYRSVDQFSCVSESVCQALELEIGKSSRIALVHNPIELKHFAYVAEPKNKDEFFIMYHGRVHPEKGLDLLFAAVNRLYEKYPFLRLKIVGPTELGNGGGGKKYIEHLEQLAGNVPVVWKGAINEPHKLAHEIALSDLYCYPSIAEKGETFGVAPLEAMAVGRTVIVSKLACFSDFLIDGMNGFVFDHRSDNAISSLSDIIERMILQPDLREQVGRKACQSALKFSVEAIAEKYLHNFEDLLCNG